MVKMWLPMMMIVTIKRPKLFSKYFSSLVSVDPIFFLYNPAMIANQFFLTWNPHYPINKFSLTDFTIMFFLYFSYHSPTYYSLQSFCLSQIFISQQETSNNQRKINLYILYINQFISKCVSVIKTLNYYSIKIKSFKFFLLF